MNMFYSNLKYRVNILVISVNILADSDLLKPLLQECIISKKRIKEGQIREGPKAKIKKLRFGLPWWRSG